MKLNYSTDSRKIKSISLIDQPSSFKFNFSHMDLEKLESIFLLLKKKVNLKGFNINFEIKKILGEGTYGKVKIQQIQNLKNF